MPPCPSAPLKPYLWKMQKGTRLLVIAMLFIVSCKKDVKEEAPPPLTAVIVPVTSGPDCSVTSITGIYKAGSPLDTSYKVVVQVDVTRTGKYFINTSLENGYYFFDSGNLATTGVQSIVLKGKGTPNGPGIDVFTLAIGNASCKFSIPVANSTGIPWDEDDHMYFGNPSNAATTIDSPNNYLMRKTFYALSYSRDRGIPNWVSWHLYTGDLGGVPRQDDFRPDVSLPQGWYQVPEFAYGNSGFDRGHNVPSADRTVSIPANSSTFLMTNMIPQAPNHNQTTWARMEDSLRALVGKGNELYIVMGTYGMGGTGSAGYANTLDNGRVTVPASVWKVAIVLPQGTTDSARVTPATRVIAVDIPNVNNVNGNWKTYRTSVDAIEAITGYDLFRRLPTALQAQLEAKVDDL